MRSILFLLAFSLPFAAYAQDPDDFPKLYDAYNEALNSGDLDAAVELAEAAYHSGKAKFGDTDRNTAMLAYNFGLVLARTAQKDNAEQYFLESIYILENELGSRTELLINPLLELGYLRLDSVEIKDFGALDNVFGQAFEIMDWGLDVYHSTYIQTAIYYVNLATKSGRRIYDRKARAYLKKANIIARTLVGDEHYFTAHIAAAYGRLAMSFGRLYESVDRFNRALEIFESQEITDSQDILAIKQDRAFVCAKLGREDCAPKAGAPKLGKMAP